MSAECRHEWTQVGRCIYCDHCNLRLQGTKPKPENLESFNAMVHAILGRKRDG